MTTTAVSHRNHSARLRSIQADLAFWTVAGAIVAVFSRSAAASWSVPRPVLLEVGIAFAILGPTLLMGLNRIRITRGLVAGFVVTNFVLTPLAWAAAAFGWLPLTGAGNSALAGAGATMLALGVWQFSTLRASQR